MRFGKTPASENTYYNPGTQRKFFQSLKWAVWAPGLRPEKVESVISFSVITVMRWKKEISAENF